MQIIVPATSANLGPGFDSLGLALKLYNKVSITPANITSIQIQGEGEGNIKLKTDNNFVKYFTRILAMHGQKGDFKFSFENSIPVSRGLGSSSAVIASAIYAAHKYLNKPLDKQEMLNYALNLEGHPDNITPAFFGGFCACALEFYSLKEGVAQRVVFSRCEVSESVRAVVVIPNKSMSTNYSRKALPKGYGIKDCVFNLSHASLLTACFFGSDFEKLRVASQDRMHQNRRMKNLPVLFSVQKMALKNGALMSVLSGSGSSFFNLCYKDDAPNLQKILQGAYPMFKVLELEFDNLGVREA